MCQIFSLPSIILLNYQHRFKNIETIKSAIILVNFIFSCVNGFMSVVAQC